MFINHCYYIPDLEFLGKYGVKPLSDESELADQAVILYSYRKKLPIPDFFLAPLIDADGSYWRMLSKSELHDYMEKKKERIKESGFVSNDIIVNKLLELSSLSGPVTNTYIDLCEKVENVPYDEFCREYPWLLITMFEQSQVWIQKEYCPFEVLEELKKYLEGLECIVETGYFDEGVNCFMKAMFESPGTAASDAFDKTDFDGFTLLIRDALPEEYFYHQPVQSAYPEKVLIEGDGWGLLRYEDRYVDIDRVVVPTLGLFDHDLIKKWIECQVLSDVIGTYYFSTRTGSYGKIAVLDRYQYKDSVRFLVPKAGGIAEDDKIGGPVPYEVIAAFNYSLDRHVYQKPDNPFNNPLVELGQICEIDKPLRGKLGGRLPYYDYTGDFKRLCTNANHPRIDTYNSEVASNLYEGPHVHISTSQRTAFVSRTPGLYHCQAAKNIALRIKDNLVFDEYLAYVLTRDMAFQNFLLTGPTEDAILRRKVAILPDRIAQEVFVNNFLEKIPDEVLSNNYYNIIWADPFLDEDVSRKLSSQFEDMLLFVRWTLSLSGATDSLESLLQQYDKPVHAVIMDAEMVSIKGRLKGLRHALDLCKAAGVPLYVYTHLTQDDLELDLQDNQASYLCNGRLFSKDSPAAVSDMLRAVRKELDRNINVDAEIRSKFRQEFLAAEWLDDNLPRWRLHLVSDLNAAVSAPNKSMNILRGALRSLYMVIIHEISNKSGLESLDLGAIPALLDDKSYRDNITTKLVFTIRGDVLPKTLARSLRLATDIVNGGSHGETIDESRGRLRVDSDIQPLGSENIAWAVIRIVMDLILYLRKVECHFEGYCETFDPNKPMLVGWEGIIKRADSREYYCETERGVSVHLIGDTNNPPIINRRIRVKILYRENRMIDRYQWCSKTGGWEYVN